MHASAFCRFKNRVCFTECMLLSSMLSRKLMITRSGCKIGGSVGAQFVRKFCMKKRLIVLNIMLLVSARTESIQKKLHFFQIFHTKVDGGTSKSHRLAQ